MSINKNIAIGCGIIAGAGIVYLAYRKIHGDALAKALNKYIDANIYSQTNPTKAAEQAITKIESMKIDTNRIHIGNLYGKYSDNPAMRDALAKTATELFDSINGAGTNLTKFFSAFFQVKNKNTMAFINLVYKSLPINKTKESLFKAMAGEIALNNTANSIYEDDKWQVVIPFFSQNRWTPVISNYLSGLSDYN